MNSSIFKAYDIRGKYPSEIDNEAAYKIGRAFVHYLRCSTVVVGHDMRASSKQLLHHLTQGMMDQGAKVLNVGLCCTPMLYFAAKDAEAGIMITASHNPAEYNGFKLCRNNCIPISGDTGLQDIRLLAEQGTFPAPERKGTIMPYDVLENFIRHNLRFAPPPQPGKRLTLVVDTGNGMGGYTFPKVFSRVYCNYIPLFEELDGAFPNHEANPIKEENLRHLQKAVVQRRATFGIATDGDADRCIAVDEKGQMVPADLMTALIAKHLLTARKAPVLYDLRSSRIVKETILANGGTPVLSRVGHSFIKKTMREQNILFGGELAGHFYYQDSFYTESSIITTLLLMAIIQQEGKPLSQIIAPLRKYAQSGEINSSVDNKQAAMARLEAAFSDAAISHVDGVTIEYPDWWCNVRASNTEPLLRLNLEADTKEKMEEKREKVLEIIRE
ncbi:phosphomannomutase/phosphoglucomutase [Candidatus Woesearchaeota archaeon]|nr:phosphomannomutase/phosphoglucomutase [Candidatus Woesearchaeota archaeon]